MSESILPEQFAKVFLLIENRLVRETLVRLFRKRVDLSVIGHASSVEAAEVLASGCDILVLDDLKMLVLLESSLHGSRTNRRIAVVLVGMEEDEEQFLTAVRSRVAAYLLSDASASDVVAAVRAAARGEAVCPPRLCPVLFRLVAELPDASYRPAPYKSSASLTIRQQQLISLVGKGLTNKEIASQLHLSEFTVKNHMHRIMKQVDVRSRSQAVAAVHALGYARTAYSDRGSQ